jgi:alpha-glucoside transport system permease protein
MVFFSAALKSSPNDWLEAARIDGAAEWEVLWHITLPSIRTTIVVVATTMTINVLKIFDIVYIMTNGNGDTNVIALRMYHEMFQFNHSGRASAIAVLLLILVIPMLVVNIRNFQAGR